MKLVAYVLTATLALPGLVSAATWNFTSKTPADKAAVEKALKTIPGATATVNGTSVSVTAPDTAANAIVSALSPLHISLTPATTTTTTTTTGATTTTGTTTAPAAPTTTK